MNDYHTEYYEQSVLWTGRLLEDPKERERIREVTDLIAQDTNSILDVGCGNGIFVNTLMHRFPHRFNRLTGLDLSEEALKYVRTEKFAGSVAKLPFEDQSFDLVTCLEVLEHLPQEDFEKGISELQRVSKKYIIITVPNDQDLATSLVMCPKCYCWFNPDYHLRSFDKNILHDLFESFKLIEAREIGPTVKERSYNPLLLTLYRSWRSVKKSPLPETAICPQCGYQHSEEFENLKNNDSSAHFLLLAVSLFKPLVELVSPVKKKTQWVLALYGKAAR